MKKIEAPKMGDLPRLYHELADFMKTCGDRRHPDDALAFILQEWLQRATGATPTGYQWGDVFLPDGSELRLHFLGESYFATVEEGELMYMGSPTSPRAWCLEVTGSVRNPWRDILVRRTVFDGWTRAQSLRKSARSPQHQRAALLPERRIVRRRARD